MCGTGRKPAKRPFDRWLQKQLQTMYDDVAHEPLPEELKVLAEGSCAYPGQGHRCPNP